MHEDTLYAFDQEIFRHPYAKVLPHLDLLSAAHAEAIKHISYVDEMYHSARTTKKLLQLALDSLDLILNTPPSTM